MEGENVCEFYFKKVKKCEFDNFKLGIKEEGKETLLLEGDDYRCKRTDGRGWRCKRGVMEGKIFCEIYYE